MRATALLAIRGDLAHEIGALDVAILIGSISTSAVLVGAILFGAVEQRRREFGIRRAQGATRSAIAGLVIVESMALAFLGTIAGGILGTVAVAGTTGGLPDPALTVSIAALVAWAAIGGSIVPALAASLREPLYVLKSE